MMFTRRNLAQFLSKRLANEVHYPQIGLEKLIEAELNDLKIEDALDVVDTKHLLSALDRRSKMLFMVRRPLAETEYDWNRHIHIDEGVEEGLSRLYGLVQRMLVAIQVEESIGDE